MNERFPDPTHVAPDHANLGPLFRDWHGIGFFESRARNREAKEQFSLKSRIPAPLIVERNFPFIAGSRLSAVSSTEGAVLARRASVASGEMALSFCSGKGGVPAGRAGFETAQPRAPDRLTHVQLTWIEKKIEHWIRFGRYTQEKILDRRRSVVSFPPGRVFAFVRWTSNDFGTVMSRIDILRTVASWEAYATVPFVDPGGEILLRLSGWPKVERVLQAVDAVEAIGIDAADAAPDHWRHVHNRLTAGETPRPYSRSRHAAWLMRRRIAP